MWRLFDGASMYAFRACVTSPIIDTAQPDYVSDNTYPAQYWSGQSQNGVVFMLVGASSSSKGSSEVLNRVKQINTLDKPATMSFNLTESPWIRAGRQYSVRVSQAFALQPSKRSIHSNISVGSLDAHQQRYGRTKLHGT